MDHKFHNLLTSVNKNAFNWILKLAEQGHVNAQHKVGILYIIGVLWPFDDGYIRDEKEGFKWIMKAAKQGLASARYDIGLLYYTGIGCEKNTKKAFKWIKKTTIF